MSKKKALKQDFMTFSGVSDMRADTSPSDRNLGDELYRKNFQSTTIDAFEKSLGIQPKTKKPNLKYGTKLIETEFVKDETFLNQLMNDPKYSIILWKDNWGMDGKFRIYVVFAENLDHKDPKAPPADAIIV